MRRALLLSLCAIALLLSIALIVTRNRAWRQGTRVQGESLVGAWGALVRRSRRAAWANQAGDVTVYRLGGGGTEGSIDTTYAATIA